MLIRGVWVTFWTMSAGVFDIVSVCCVSGEGGVVGLSLGSSQCLSRRRRTGAV